VDRAPQNIPEYVAAIRARLVCDRCGKYVGSLTESTYLPPPYPIAAGAAGPDDEVAAMVSFEWHMANKLSDDIFTIRHPQSKGRCVSVRQWYDERGDDDDGVEDDDDDDDGDDAA
jgi:hypothetical protein